MKNVNNSHKEDFNRKCICTRHSSSQNNHGNNTNCSEVFHILQISNRVLSVAEPHDNKSIKCISTTLIMGLIAYFTAVSQKVMKYIMYFRPQRGHHKFNMKTITTQT